MFLRSIIFGHELSLNLLNNLSQHPLNHLISVLWFLFERKTKKETNLQNPEVLEAREVHFSDSCNVVSVQIPAERNTGVTSQIFNKV